MAFDVEEQVEVATVEPTEQQKLSASLRELADFYDAHPELSAPDWQTEFTVFNVKKEDLPLYAKAFGSAEKYFDEYSFQLQRKFGDKILLRTYSSRETVCERVKIGEKTVPAHVVPAKPAEEEKYVEEAVVDVFEWKCPDAILKPKPVEEEAGDGDGVSN
jgi:hypothetical protein